MDRRTFLAALGATGLAGCVGEEPTPTATRTPPGSSLAEQGFPPELCSEELTDLNIIPIDDPAYGDDWADVDPAQDGLGDLGDDATVIGVERGGTARAYPVTLLWHHEVVNDVLPDGEPLLVTYCSLCRSGMVAARRVDGEPARFGVSGLLWRPPSLWQQASEDGNRSFAARVENSSAGLSTRNAGNLVMYDDRTGSYWSQVLAQGLCGPQARVRLDVVPSTVAAWGDWRRAHPGTEVLLPLPASGTGNPPYPGESPP